MKQNSTKGLNSSILKDKYAFDVSLKKFNLVYEYSFKLINFKLY